MKRTIHARLLAAPVAVALLAGGALVLSAGPVGAVTVTNAAELRAAFEDPNNGEVTLANDIVIDDDCDDGDIERPSDATVPMVLDGAGFTITQTCDSERVFDLEDGDFDVTFRNVTVTGGETTADGGGIEAHPLGDEGSDLLLTIEDSTIVGNFACSDGGGVEVDNGASLLFNRSTATSNTALDESGALDDDNSEPDGGMTIVNSTVTDNTSVNDGAVGSENANVITTVYSTIVENVNAASDSIVTPIICSDSLAADDDDAGQDGDEEGVDTQDIGEPANVGLEEDATLTTFGTVIALPAGLADTPNCVDEDNDPPGVTSLGYNYSDDDSCGLTDPTDVQNGADPQLGVLASNGGPTQTRLPATASPLVNAIPVDACAGGDESAGFAVTTDQRGVARPQETGCEIGSVEIEAPPTPEPIVLVPTFTG